MPIYKPTELHQFLEEIGAAPKKGLSQNFLTDGNILRKIVKTADVMPGDVILEIGPGPGSLTEELLKAGAHVIAVEKDVKFAGALDRLQTPDNRLQVYCADIMEFPIKEKLQPFLEAGKKAKTIANLPYHLTTPIIASLVTHDELFSLLVLMVQEEVARRFTAKPRTSDYSSFTVFLQFYSTPSYGFMVSKSCFYPSPKVDSAIVKLELKEAALKEGVEDFFQMTRTAFEHRRKMLRGSLKELYGAPEIEKALLAIGKSEKSRPEELSLNEFISLFQVLRSG